jgi:hypothetical protein
MHEPARATIAETLISGLFVNHSTSLIPLHGTDGMIIHAEREATLHTIAGLRQASLERDRREPRFGCLEGVVSEAGANQTVRLDVPVDRPRDALRVSATGRSVSDVSDHHN